MGKQYLYWMPEAEFQNAKKMLKEEGYSLWSAPMTPCQVLWASGKRVIYATPGVFSRMCVRQGSWYRASEKRGQYMMVSACRLPEALEEHLEAEISESSFQPQELPSASELEDLVAADEYQDNKPKGWEDIGVKDAVMYKSMFTMNRFWGWGDNLKKHWLGHQANHANFLARRFTTEIDGEQVPYSVTENAGVCSSCVEFFNIINPDERKLVRACPGSATFGGVKRDVYIDINPRSTT